MDLLTLPIDLLLAATTTLYMEWLALDEDVRKVYGRFIATLAQAATPNAVSDPSLGTEENPFPDVMRSGSAGVVGSKT